MLTSKTAILIVACVLSINGTSISQPEIITYDGELPYGFGGYPRPIAIGAGPENRVKAIWIRERLDWRYDLFFAQRDEYGFWESRYVGDLANPCPGLFLGNDGRAFIYSGDGRLFIEDGDQFISREMFGSPIMDSTGCFHRLSSVNGYYLYSFSDDTLQSISYQDTVYYDAILLGLEASADRGVVCAIFAQTDSLYKYIGQAGLPLHFDSSMSYPADGEMISISRVDIGVGKSGQIFIPWIGEGGGEYWASLHVWSEGFGSRFLSYLDDPVLNGFQLETCFAGNRDTVLILESTRFYGHSWTVICFSTDAGDIWYHSLEAPSGGNCTAPRLSTDNLQMITEDSNQQYVYYEAIPITLILENYTSIQESSPLIPSNFMLSNYPNPFNSSTTISFTLPEAGHVSLAVYDITGRLVNTLVNADVDAGRQTVIWDGAGQSGRLVSSGIYFYTLRSGEFSSSGRMLLLK